MGKDVDRDGAAPLLDHQPIPLSLSSLGISLRGRLSPLVCDSSLDETQERGGNRQLRAPVLALGRR